MTPGPTPFLVRDTSPPRTGFPLACANVTKKYLSDIAQYGTTPALPICPDTKWLGSKRLKA